jgi:hypothetical protein
MTNGNYELRIISKDQQSDGKVLKKYIIDGQEVVGAMENEPFAIEFKNKTWSKLQVRISVDGTDIQTGELASTSPDGTMWMVEPYGILNLKAWPESSKGGAEFLFGKVEDSVAENTHGNMSGKGIIACAIFIEGHNPHNINPWGGVLIGGVYTYGAQTYGGIGNFGAVIRNSSYNISSNSASGGILRSKSIMPKVLQSRISTADSYDTASASVNIAECSENLAVGAGEYVAQEIVKVAGLTKPVLNTTVSVKYESWNSLRSKVRALQKQVVNGSNPAFPGDVPMKMIDLKSTPRKSKSRKPARTPDLQRF